MTDLLMINDLRKGKEQGLKEIYRLYKRPLLYFSLQFVDRETAEEIVSDSFVKVWNMKEQFHTMENLKAFLYISSKNACLNHLRRPQSKWRLQDVDTWDDALVEDADVYTAIVKAELLKEIAEEVAKLPQKQRDVFNMIYLEDMSVEEVCQQLQITPTAVYTYRSRAITSLRGVLKAKDSLYLLLLTSHFFSI